VCCVQLPLFASDFVHQWRIIHPDKCPCSWLNDPIALSRQRTNDVQALPQPFPEWVVYPWIESMTAIWGGSGNWGLFREFCDFSGKVHIFPKISNTCTSQGR
jgi:hypothetical protein